MSAGTLGVIGGVGPIASTAFLRTLYEYSARRSEQAMPSVMLISDPSVPDRTDALVNGTANVLLERLYLSVARLINLQCSQIVVCCVTMHGLIPELPDTFRSRIVSLVDVAIDQVRERGERQLLFCSSGTRLVQTFERHPRWPEVERLVVLPEARDQERIHRFIYAIKRTGNARRHLRATSALLAKYGTSSLIVGCTEFHLLTRAARHRAMPWRTCDPLDVVAKTWADPEPVFLTAS